MQLFSGTPPSLPLPSVSLPPSSSPALHGFISIRWLLLFKISENLAGKYSQPPLPPSPHIHKGRRERGNVLRIMC
ncbi:hypothetical protein GDO81_012377 [Engystomops pustulosus]|uniref:Uncharacterized protein n=1 Tax=Engystomops pustulosus TaxID=76066 RepID=A0AAV7BL34_ENGPU|nr:hypothetical protein GDO81_012377 [Engystomops pustulosus]